MIAALAAAELEDAGQLKHVLSVEAPPSAEYLPAMQPVQVLSAEAPGVVEYLPAMQSMHELATNAPGPVEYLPAPQSMHEAAPVTALNFPASHATHVPPFGPVWPAYDGRFVRPAHLRAVSSESKGAHQLQAIALAEFPGDKSAGSYKLPSDVCSAISVMLQHGANLPTLRESQVAKLRSLARVNLFGDKQKT